MPGTESSRAVFLSYASQDAEAAGRICEALRAAGIEVWFDQSELRGGDAWDAAIRKQIRECALFVPIILANTQAREEGYFRREWKMAVDRTMDMAEGKEFLLPVVIDATLDVNALVPEKFREVQWTRLPASPAISELPAAPVNVSPLEARKRRTSVRTRGGTMGSGRDRGGAVQQGLAARLRGETHALHVKAERAGVMPAILKGRVTAALYCLLLRNLHAIYVQLESSLRQHAHEASVAPVVFPELFREVPLSQDLCVFYGEAWRTEVPRLPTTQRYVERLVVIGAEQPVLLVAHAYVRYLGDLSGGQLLARVVRSLVPAGAASGTQFYEFGAAHEVAELARRFRAGLDAVPVDAEAAAAIIGEAQWAFRAHAQLFEEIAAGASEEPAPAHPLV